MSSYICISFSKGVDLKLFALHWQMTYTRNNFIQDQASQKKKKLYFQNWLKKTTIDSDFMYT